MVSSLFFFLSSHKHRSLFLSCLECGQPVSMCPSGCEGSSQLSLCYYFFFVIAASSLVPLPFWKYATNWWAASFIPPLTLLFPPMLRLGPPPPDLCSIITLMVWPLPFPSSHLVPQCSLLPLCKLLQGNCVFSLILCSFARHMSIDEPTWSPFGLVLVDSIFPIDYGAPESHLTSVSRSPRTH
jgi:hypothetical protein